MDKYEYAQNIVNTNIFKEDELTFSVLKAIVNGNCECVITDHSRVIICYSCPPFPVWIWAKDDVTDEEIKEIYSLIQTEFPFEKGYSFNTKYELAHELIQLAKEDGVPLYISVNLCTYDCKHPIEPDKHPDGEMVCASKADADEIAEFVWLFKQETGVDLESKERCKELVQSMILSNMCYIWKNESGNIVAMCSYNSEASDGTNVPIGKVTHVYTKMSERRKGYAEMLVYHITKKIMNEGMLPVLYTDADYQASNECYKKIGYVEKGKLCTLQKR